MKTNQICNTCGLQKKGFNPTSDCDPCYNEKVTLLLEEFDESYGCFEADEKIHQEINGGEK